MISIATQPSSPPAEPNSCSKDILIRTYQRVLEDISLYRLLFTSPRFEATPLNIPGADIHPIDAFNLVRVDSFGQVIGSGDTTLYSYSAKNAEGESLTGRAVVINLTSEIEEPVSLFVARCRGESEFLVRFNRGEGTLDLTDQEGAYEIFCVVMDFHNDINNESQDGETFRLFNKSREWVPTDQVREVVLRHPSVKNI